MTDADTRVSPSPVRSTFSPLPRRGRGIAAMALLGAFAAGAGTAALTMNSRRASVVALTPAPITAMREWSQVAVRGQVAEVFGNKFVISDDTGRALVDTGPAGEGSSLVTPSEAVTIQGRFERGLVHAALIQHTDGRTDFVGPSGPRSRRGLLSWSAAAVPSRWFGWRPARSS